MQQNTFNTWDVRNENWVKKFDNHIYNWIRELFKSYQIDDI